ncbi:hypothetical protein U8V72_17555 [Priestia filamentosa]|uniref:hypothetical protein n=1 Tax=Priestia filamentosa TaxID=1402861 RepID=UPI00058908C5
MSDSVELYKIRKDVICLKCNNKGAVRSYGQYYPYGVGNLANEIKSYEDVRNEPYMMGSLGFGGTIPYECLNCGNSGLIDFGGLEGYKMAFKSVAE